MLSYPIAAKRFLGMSSYDFSLIALVIFLIIKTINYLHHQPLTNLTKLNAQEKLLTEIRDLLQTNQTHALTEPLMQMPTVTHQ
jgi:large-conductance mechanosensitive channel